MTERLRCCVPYCRRTFKAQPGDTEATEVMCGKHWRLAPKAWRQRRSKIWRRYRKHHGDRSPWDYPAGSKQRIEAVRLSGLLHKLWERCRDAAIEAAGGI